MDKKKAPQAHLGSDEEAAEEGVLTMIKRGVESENAWHTANSQKKAWRNSRTDAMHRAFPNSFFEEMGLISLALGRQESSEVS